MKKRHKIFLFALLVCLAMCGMTVSAADDRLGTIVDGSLLTDGESVEFEVYPSARGVFLASGSGSLTIAGSRYLCMSGRTTSYQSVDELSVSLMLQRLVGNSWVYVSELPTKTAYNTYNVSTTGYKTVTGGYYYRIYGVHAATEGGTSEALASYSNGIWVD